MNKPDKGKKNGSCNVTACQKPLAGTMQGWMVDYMVKDGRFYYCAECCRRFNEWDDRLIAAGQQEKRRITWDETTGPRIAGVHEDEPRYQCRCFPCGKTFIADSKHRRICPDCQKCQDDHNDAAIAAKR